ncbi:hypothetical protein AVEN_62497-1 [Araneus ventricosus]|uniref:Uncharacterized protein n=1 Tax=Araneus ventricosus TaxID=182803 RepID=A0A4Y2G1X1_ARAVE|nr:hypothetical protein AVEN_62497-1 [Araneus ventricosus]
MTSRHERSYSNLPINRTLRKSGAVLDNDFSVGHERLVGGICTSAFTVILFTKRHDGDTRGIKLLSTTRLTKLAKGAVNVIFSVKP